MMSARMSPFVACCRDLVVISLIGTPLALPAVAQDIARHPAAGSLALPVPAGPAVSVVLEFETRDFDFRSYTAILTPAFYRGWLHEAFPEAQAGVFGREQLKKGLKTLGTETTVRCTVDRSGHVSDVTILKPSALEVFDHVAFEAVRTAALPPLPQSSPHDREALTVRFSLSPKYESDVQLRTRLDHANQRHEF